MKKLLIILPIVVLLAGLGYVFPAKAIINTAGATFSDSNGTVYLITTENGQLVKRPYTSAGAFLSYGFNSWENVINQQFLDNPLLLPTGSFIPPRDGSIMCSDRGSDRGTCYLISEGKKLGFVSDTVFKNLGFNFAMAGDGDVSWMPDGAVLADGFDVHKPGTLINLNGTIYLVGTGSDKFGFPDMGTLKSWGYSLKDVVVGNSADRSYLQASLGVLVGRQPGQLAPYTIKSSPLNSATGNNSQCVSIQAPDSIPAGQQFTTQIVMQNTGTRPWTNSIPGQSYIYKLFTSPTDNLTWGADVIDISSGGDPGTQVVFNQTFTAPATLGVYDFQWQMKDNSLQWFGDTCNKKITVVSASNPTLSRVSPTSGAPGAGLITLYGNNFDTSGINYIKITQKNCVVQTGSQSCAPFWVTVNTYTAHATEMSFVMPSSLINPYATPGIYLITLTTTKGGSAVSNPLEFNLLPTQ